MEFPDSNLWTHTTQLWTLPEVEAICLELQNMYDADVNILLYCCWIGNKSLDMNEDDMQTLLDTVTPWQTMIKPLRDSRKMMQQQLIAMPSHLVEQTINNMNQMELNAEHMTQLALEKAFSTEKTSPINGPSSVECSFHNINLYLHSLESIPSIDEIMHKISQLLNAIYQDEEAVQMALMNGD